MNGVCKRCLLSDADMNDVYASVQRAIDGIPPRLKTSPDEYARRLNRCRECDHLVAGTCLRCGCYVELRAATAAAHCPDKTQKW